MRNAYRQNAHVATNVLSFYRSNIHRSRFNAWLISFFACLQLWFCKMKMIGFIPFLLHNIDTCFSILIAMLYIVYLIWFYCVPCLSIVRLRTHKDWKTVEIRPFGKNNTYLFIPNKDPSNFATMLYFHCIGDRNIASQSFDMENWKKYITLSGKTFSTEGELWQALNILCKNLVHIFIFLCRYLSDYI